MARKSQKIKRPIQLIAQANSCSLLPKDSFYRSIPHALSWGGDLAKTPRYSGDPLKRPRPQTIYVRPDGCPYSFSRSKEGSIPYIQKIRIKHSDTKGRGYRDKIIDPVEYYETFVGLKERHDLEAFIEKHEFSIFPDIDESIELLKKYEAAGIAAHPIFHARTRSGDDADQAAKKMARTIQKKIYDINLEFIWQKKEQLEEISRRYADQTLEYHKLHWINRQMENISNALIDKDHQIFGEVAAWSEEEAVEDTRDLGATIGMKNVADMSIVPAIRVYGHFALCCHVLYERILADKKIGVCEHPDCHALFIPTSKANTFCRNPECTTRRNNEKSAMSYARKHQ